MSHEIVLFHHAQGLTSGVVAFADALRRAGNTVHTPDLYGQRTFMSINDGVSHAEEIGFPEIIARGERAVEALPEEIVYMGISLGVLPAQKLAQTRAGARGAVLLSACIPYEEFSEVWPEDVAVQIHGMTDDPFFAEEGDLDAAHRLIDVVADARLLLYPGNRHLFMDSSSPDYDRDATALLLQRVLSFVSRH